MSENESGKKKGNKKSKEGRTFLILLVSFIGLFVLSLNIAKFEVDDVQNNKPRTSRRKTTTSEQVNLLNLTPREQINHFVQ